MSSCDPLRDVADKWVHAMKMRNIIKRLALGVVSAGSTMVIAACYGAYYSEMERNLVHGTVTDEQNQTVQSLEVCAAVEPEWRGCTSTNTSGDYSMNVEEQIYDMAVVNGFSLVVRDVDDWNNGAFLDAEIEVTPDEMASNGAQIDVVMEAVDDENDETDSEDEADETESSEEDEVEDSE